MKNARVDMRMSEKSLGKLDKLAAAKGWNRTQTVVALIERAYLNDALTELTLDAEQFGARLGLTSHAIDVLMEAFKDVPRDLYSQKIERVAQELAKLDPEGRLWYPLSLNAMEGYSFTTTKPKEPKRLKSTAPELQAIYAILDDVGVETIPAPQPVEADTEPEVAYSSVTAIDRGTYEQEVAKLDEWFAEAIAVELDRDYNPEFTEEQYLYLKQNALDDIELERLDRQMELDVAFSKWVASLPPKSSPPSPDRYHYGQTEGEYS